MSQGVAAAQPSPLTPAKHLFFLQKLHFRAEASSQKWKKIFFQHLVKEKRIKFRPAR